MYTQISFQLPVVVSAYSRDYDDSKFQLPVGPWRFDVYFPGLWTKDGTQLTLKESRFLYASEIRAMHAGEQWVKAAQEEICSHLITPGEAEIVIAALDASPKHQEDRTVPADKNTVIKVGEPTA